MNGLFVIGRRRGFDNAILKGQNMEKIWKALRNAVGNRDISIWRIALRRNDTSRWAVICDDLHIAVCTPGIGLWYRRKV